MKNLFLFIAIFIYPFFLNAQVSKNVSVTPGNLSNTLTLLEKNTITQISIEGSIDSRDFKTLRDSMPLLVDIDMTNVTIVEYEGNLGTLSNSNTLYKQNTIPNRAFYKSSGCQINTILLPNSAVEIDSFAFTRCSKIKNLTIPQNVKSIGSYVFQDCINLISISIPTTVTYIGRFSFNNCYQLKSFIIPTSLTILQEALFSNCSSLENIIIPSNITSIGINCFEACKRIKEINLPSSITSIGDGAFSKCFYLKKINIPNSVTNLGNYVFSDCINLEDITISESISVIKMYTFSGCKNLKKINIPSSITSIEASAFHECFDLESIILPSNLKSIGNDCFYKCGKLKSIIIPEKVTSIGDAAFRYCLNLSNVKLSSSLTQLNTYIFNNCKSLYSISIPASITKIYDDALTNCQNLNYVFINSTTPPTLISAYSPATVFSADYIIVPNGLKSLYNNLPKYYGFNISDEKSIFTKDSIFNIDYLNDCNAIFSVYSNTNWTVEADQNWITINKNFLDENTYELNCSASSNNGQSRTAKILIYIDGILKKTIIINQNGVINSKKVIVTAGNLHKLILLNERNNISKLELEGTINAVDFKTMRDSLLLKELDLSKVQITSYTGTNGTSTYSTNYSQNAIPPNAFSVYGKEYPLSKIILPLSLEEIGSAAFSFCSKLYEINIPSNVKILNGFYNCYNLKKINIPNSVTQINASCFKNCYNLENVNISNSVTQIGEYAFQNCLTFTDINIPNSVTSIGRNAFDSCKNVKKVNIPASVKTIAYWGFNYCNSVDSLIIPPSINTLNECAFAFAKELVTLSIPSTITTAYYSNTLEGCSNLSYLYMYLPKPPSAGSNTLVSVDKNSCILYVPYGSKSIYQSTNYWKDFKRIIEMEGVTPSTNYMTISAKTTNSKIDVAASSTWTANSNQSWLTLNPTSNFGKGILTILTTENLQNTPRTAQITLLDSLGNTSIITVCQKQKNSILLVSDTSKVVLSSESNNETFTIISDNSWTITSNQSWISTSQNTGSNDALITLHVDKNLDSNNRTALIEISSNTETKLIKIIQNAATSLNLNKTVINIGASSNLTNSFTITTNANWNVTSDQQWITLSSISGNGNNTITIESEENLNTIERTAILTITSDGISKTISVIQAANLPTLTLSTSIISLSNENNTATFDITSNSTWSISNNSDWLTISKLSGTGNSLISITAAENMTVSERNAIISIDVDGISKTISVTQLAGDVTLSVSTSTISLSKNSNSATLEITSNAYWTVTNDSDWLTISKLSGSGNETISILASSNNGQERTAILSIIASDSQLKVSVEKTITVVQASDGTVSINENINNNELLIFPNPTSSFFYTNISDALYIEIFSQSGELLLKKQISANEKVSVSNLITGVYLLKITTESNNRYYKNLIIK